MLPEVNSNRTPIVVGNAPADRMGNHHQSNPIANQNFAGIYSSAGALLGSSAAGSLDSKVTSLGVITQPLASPVPLGPGFYWAALMFNGTTPPVVATAPNNLTNANAGLSAASYRWATNGTGTTALPASVTPSSNGTGSGAVAYWVGVS